MFNRPFSTVLTRLAIVAAILATLLLIAPAASAATKMKYAENGTDAVARFTATDEDGHPIEWTLNGPDKGDFEISDAGVLTFKNSPNFESPADANKDNEYLVTVKASEASALELEITVTDVDEPGEVELDQIQPQVGRSMTATLKDPDSGVEAERWQWARSADMETWIDIDKATSATRSPVEDDLGMYLRATVVYDDGFGADKTAYAESENAVEEKTTANAAPKFKDETGSDVDDDPTTSGDQNDVVMLRKVDEGVKGANVGRPITATDADNDVLLYSITGTTGHSYDGEATDKTDRSLTALKELFYIHPRSGQLKTKTKTLDSDDDGLTGASDTHTPYKEATYVLTVTATDPSGATGDVTVKITITDVNDPPKITAATDATSAANQPALTVAENGTILAPASPTYTATDDDAGDDATTNTGVTPPTTALEYAVEGADKGDFDISAAGLLTFKSGTKVDYEAKNEYSITIVATDDSAPEGRGTLDVTVTVTNAEDPGKVKPSEREPQVGREVVASLKDEDGSLYGQSWQWYRSVTAGQSAQDTETALSANSVTACDASSPSTPCRIPGATSPNYTPVAADVHETLRLAARVTYTDGHVTAVDANATPIVDAGDKAHVVMQASVQAAGAANAAPKFADDQDLNAFGKQADAARSVPENAKGAAVGLPVTASDADGDLLVYTIGGPDAASFTIDGGLVAGGSPGQISTAVKLNYEKKSSYAVVVTARDPSGATDSVNVNITVTDVDDKTEIAAASDDTKIKYAENGSGPVATLTASDEDPDDTIEWTLDGPDKGDFEISDAGVLTFKKKPDFESPADANKNNTYLVTVKASEASKLELEITVTDVDEAGKVDLDQPQPQVGRSMTATLKDPDSGVEDERWQWAKSASADGPFVDIDKATSATRSPVAAEVGMYLRATVVYQDDFGTGKTAFAVSENAVEAKTTANAAPSFKGLDENKATTGVEVTRNVDEQEKGANVGRPIMATDADNDVLLYSVDDTNFSIAPRSGQLKTAKKLTSNNGEGADVTHTVTVTATDPSGAKGTVDVAVTINDVNDDPKITAVTTGTEGRNRTSLTVVENTSTLDANPATEVQNPTYLATDADYTDHAIDVDADGSNPARVALTYAVEGADGDAFKLTADTSSGVQTLAFKKADPKVNYETKDEYSITIVATDDDAPEGRGTLDVTVTVKNAEDIGVVWPSQREPQVGTQVVANLSDQDGGESNLEWQWYRNANLTSGNVTTLANLVQASSDCAADGSGTDLCKIKGAKSPNYTPVAHDKDRVLAVLVTYTDSCLRTVTSTSTSDLPCVTTGTDAKDRAHVLMQKAVQDVRTANAAPKFSDDQDLNTTGKQADAKRSVNENADKATVGDPVTAADADGDLLIYGIGGADAASFTIDSGLKANDTPGQIKTAVKLDYETKSSYTVVVTATDPSGATDSVNVIISVNDVDDKTLIRPNTDPEFATATDERSVDENSAAGTAVGAPVTATDADEADEGKLVYTLGGDDAASFAIDSATGQISVGEGAMLNHETTDSYSVTVTATDTGGRSASIDVTIAVADVNEAPMFAADTADRSVDENSEAGTTVGDAVTASDVDDGDTRAYSLDDGDDAASFAIDSATGQITVAEGADLNYEAKTTYMVTVTATDSDGLTDTIAVTVMINDVAETPVFDEGETATRSVEENSAAGTAVGDPVTAMHAESYSDDSDSFDVGAMGQLTVAAGAMLDYETMTSHTVTITATGVEGETDDITVTVTVTNAQVGCDDAGTVGLVNDCEALLDSKAALDGSLNWTDHTHTTMPDWTGVTMTDGRVTSVDLRDSNLNGTVPAALGRLSALTYLNLRNNELTGSIPAELGNLSSLTYLSLLNNSLSGDIPDLSGMTSLEQLYLNKNGLTGGVPAMLPASVTKVWLWDNDLSGSVPDMSGLVNLIELKLAANNLTGGVPMASMLPPNVRMLTLHDNPNLGGTIPDLGSLTNLRTLWIHTAGLTGEVPATLPTSLSVLNLKDNSLSSLANLSELDNLRKLYLHRNDLGGSIPGSMGGLERLSHVYLYGNELTGIDEGFAGAADTLVDLFLKDNPWADGTCLPGDLADVANNDFEDAGLTACAQ